MFGLEPHHNTSGLPACRWQIVGLSLHSHSLTISPFLRIYVCPIGLFSPENLDQCIPKREPPTEGCGKENTPGTGSSKETNVVTGSVREGADPITWSLLAKLGTESEENHLPVKCLNKDTYDLEVSLWLRFGKLIRGDKESGYKSRIWEGRDGECLRKKICFQL